MVKVTGEVMSLGRKTTSGKVIQLTQGSDASYMSWNSAPEEAEKLEFELPGEDDLRMTQTPNISLTRCRPWAGICRIRHQADVFDAHIGRQRIRSNSGRCTSGG